MPNPVQLKSIGKKRQITATFSISRSEEFLPIKVIYGDSDSDL